MVTEQSNTKNKLNKINYFHVPFDESDENTKFLNKNEDNGINVVIIYFFFFLNLDKI